MSSKRYPEEFKIEAVRQITERGHPVAEVSRRIGVSQHSLYGWLKRYGVPEAERIETQSQSAEIRRLKAELRRVTEERDILKKAAAYFAKQSG
jgi:transposase